LGVADVARLIIAPSQNDGEDDETGANYAKAGNLDVRHGGLLSPPHATAPSPPGFDLDQKPWMKYVDEITMALQPLDAAEIPGSALKPYSSSLPNTRPVFGLTKCTRVQAVRVTGSYADSP
jgi:hypothetical protein